MLTTLRSIFYFEWTLLLRRSQEWLYPLGFFAIVITLFPLAFTPDPVFLQKYVPGCIWIAALLASMLSVEHLFAADIEEAYLEQMVLSQLPLSLLLLTKLAAQWLTTQLPLILLTPIIGILFHLPFSTVWTLCLGLLLGTPVLMLTGCLGTVLTLGLRQQGVLLSLLMLPLVVPILIFGVSIVQQSQAGLSITGPLSFLAGIFFLSITLLPVTIAATIKISLDN